MNRRKEDIEKLVDEHLGLFDSPSAQELSGSRERTLGRLRARAAEPTRPAIATPRRTAWRRRFPAISAATLALFVVFTLWPSHRNGVYAVVDATGERIDVGGTVTSGIGGTVLKLADGSAIEMRSKSELVLERADDGIRIRLSHGGVIVNAAEQRTGHLYVQTKHMTATVVGTVFFVNAEEDGSRVAVIEGEVRVKQGTTEKKLFPGDQVSTSPKMESVPVKEEIAWSRQAEAHMALLEQARPQSTPEVQSNAQATQQSPPGGAIEGFVLRGDTEEPVVGAKVTLTLSAAVPVGQRPVSLPLVTTPADGRFSFKDLAPANYRISVTANGFARQEYGQSAVYTQGRVVAVAAGQTMTNATIRLISTATVSGRIVDDSGQPATGAPVQLVRLIYNVLGPANHVAGTSAVDDRGNYRFFDVAPGRYYLVAGTPPGPSQQAGVRGSGRLDRFSMVYYPNAEDFEKASLIEVKSGADSFFDMRVRKLTKTYSVRGRVVSSPGTLLPPSVNLYVVFQSFNLSGAINVSQSFDPFTGAFEVRDVPPGDYVLQLLAPSEQPMPALPAEKTPNPIVANQRQAAWASRPSARARIRVGDGDLNDVQLVLAMPVSTTGRVVIEGRALPSETELQQMRLSFIDPTPNFNQTPPIALPPAADGTFRITGLIENEYRVLFAINSPGLYAKSVRYGGEDVLDKPLRFVSGAPVGTFEVVLHPGISQIAGTVTDAQSQPVLGIQVVAIPSRRGRRDLYQTGITDQTGRFTFTNLPPVRYKLFSWEAVENSAYYNPEFLKQYEQQGKTVILAESSTATVDLKMISVRR